jgi:hypothetical protein
MHAKPNYLVKNVLSHAKDMGEAARSLSKGRNVLYKGTRYHERNFATGAMHYSRFGDQAVFFSRDPLVAAYWAVLPGDWLGGQGVIFAFDRDKLKTRYPLKTSHFHDFVHHDHIVDEMEETIWGRDIYNFTQYLIGVVWEGTAEEKPAANYSCPDFFVGHDWHHINRAKPHAA